MYVVCALGRGVGIIPLWQPRPMNRSSTTLAAACWFFPVMRCSICIGVLKSWSRCCCNNPAPWGAMLCQSSPFASPYPGAERWQALCLLVLVGAIIFAAVLIPICSPTPAQGFKYLQVEWAGFWSEINMIQLLWMWLQNLGSHHC